MTIDEGLEALKKKFLGNDVTNVKDEELKDATLEIADVRYLVVDNTTRVYITDTQGNEYKLTLSTRNEDTVAFLKAGDTIKVKYLESGVRNITEITK